MTDSSAGSSQETNAGEGQKTQQKSKVLNFHFILFILEKKNP